LGEGYTDWFGMAPEGKFPTRTGTPQDARRFQQAWEQSEAGVDVRMPLTDAYSADISDELGAGVARMDRWGIPQGRGRLVGSTLGELPVPRAVNALTSGQVDAAEAAQ